MIAAGVVALAFGMAQTAVDRSFDADVWWSGEFIGACAVGVSIAAMGVRAGSRAWLGITRALLAVLALFATIAMAGEGSDGETFIMLDEAWLATSTTWRALLAGCAAIALALAIFLARPRTVRPA